MLRFRRSRAGRLLSLIAAAAALVVLLDLCLPPPLQRADRGFSQVILAADGSLLRAFADQAGMWRYPVTPDQVSPRYLQALLNYEDRWFYRHPGVNPLSLIRAAWQHLRHGRAISGGSTLTMQVARLLERQPRTVTGKLVQMLRALQLERRLSKRQILTLYLNLAPFGGPIEGVEAAAQSYLGKSAEVLSYAEAALLAALPQRPSVLRPDRHADRARRARDKVLRRLAAFGVWPKAVVADARQEPVAVFRPARPLLAPLLARRLRHANTASMQQTAATTSAAQRVHTTLAIDLQYALQDLLRDHIGRATQRSSGALLVLNNADAQVLAYVGSGDFLDARRFGHVDMVRAHRSYGSTLKPLLYGLALDDGLIHSASLLLDSPLDIDGYRPSNFSGRYRGPVSATEALQHSLNVPAVDLLRRYGAERFAAQLRNAGLRLRLPQSARPNLAIILGGAATSLWELTGLYRALAHGGLSATPRVRPDTPLDERRLLSTAAAWVVRDMLAGAKLPAGVSRSSTAPIAWKTGTSYGFRDAWALGVSNTHTVGVWLGRPDGTPSPGQYGAVSAAPLLFQVFRTVSRHGAEPRRPTAPRPPAGVRQHTICWPLGIAAAQTVDRHCRQRLDAWVINDTIPPTLPTHGANGITAAVLHFAIDPASGLRVGPDCWTGARTTHSVARWPVGAGPWLSARQRRHSEPPPWHPNCPAAPHRFASIRIQYPRDGDTLQMPPHPLRITARARADAEYLIWLNNGVFVARQAPHAAVAMPLQLGRNRITAMAAGGSHHTVQILVRKQHTQTVIDSTRQPITH